MGTLNCIPCWFGSSTPLSSSASGTSSSWAERTLFFQEPLTTALNTPWGKMLLLMHLWHLDIPEFGSAAMECQPRGTAV